VFHTDPNIVPVAKNPHRAEQNWWISDSTALVTWAEVLRAVETDSLEIQAEGKSDYLDFTLFFEDGFLIPWYTFWVLFVCFGFIFYYRIIKYTENRIIQ
jgi:hypothetical protein